MKRLALVVIVFMLVGCETTINWKDAEGIEYKLSETAFLSLQTTQSMIALGTPVDSCAGLIPDNMAELSASGQESIGRAMEMCQIRVMVSSAGGMPSTPQGQVAAANSKTSIAIEQGQAAKAATINSMATFGLGAYFGYKAVDSAGKNAGSEYNVSGIQMSNSGATGGAGGEGGGGGVSSGGNSPATTASRGMQLVIGGDGHMQNGSPSSAFAVGDKSPAFESPISNNAPNFDDGDVVKDNKAGISPF